MEEVFLLEDDVSLGKGIQMALKSQSTTVTLCHTLREARKVLALKQFQLLILDVNLPDGNGLDLLKEQKNLHPEVSVILLTANDMELDVVTGLEAGADDYITKPFSLAILRARVNAQLRRTIVSPSAVFSNGIYHFDFEQMIYRKNGYTVELSRTEQKLLRVLIENRGHAVSRSALVDYIWTDGAEYVEENALTVTVKRLRAKLEEEPGKPVYLKTVYGIGYTWAVKI